ncbi:MAG: ABC transporter ATP-binding protein [Acidobacteriota bacterium]
MSVPAVEALALTRVFAPRAHSGPGVTALREVSFVVPRGAIVALIGANGAGKTTALDVAATLLMPTAGDVRVCGRSVINSAKEVRELVAYCAAGGSSFWPRLTGRENLECFSALAGIGPTERPARLADAVERVGLPADVLKRETRTYSDGQLQRLNLARAVMRDVSVWLLDEPTRSLDEQAQHATWALIREAAHARGVSVLVATHDSASVAEYADDVVRLP